MNNDIESGQIIDASTPVAVVTATEQPTSSEANSFTMDTSVDSPEVIDMPMQEGIPGAISLSTSISHTQSDPNQHTIGAITGLQETLDNIQELKETIYTNNTNEGNYYIWQDENPSAENREGLFVAMCEGKLKVCEDTDEIFGVTVDEAGFVGGQEETARDYKYGLVVNTGLVKVRCESNVVVGDYVSSDDFGIAQKNSNEYGYKVLSIIESGELRFANISLSISAREFCNLSNCVQSMETRMNNAETNIITAINVANDAHNITSNISTEVIAIANEALSKADTAVDTVESYDASITSAVIAATEARAIATTAASTAENLRSQAVSTANEASANINNLISELEPLTSWDDGNGNIGAEYLIDRIDNGLATKTEVQTAENKSQNALTATEKNAKKLQSIARTIDTYSVGEFTQAYGLTWVQAQSLLENGMIYVPTVSHEEVYSDQSFEFTITYYYTWDDDIGWIESEIPAVYFSSNYVIGGSTNLYWYVNTTSDVVNNGITYSSHTLYLWEDNAWTALASLSGNVTNRSVSILRQTANEITAEVTNARGSSANLSAKLDNMSAETAMVSALYEPSDITISGTVALFDNLPVTETNGVYYAVGSNLPYKVYRYNGPIWREQKHLSYDGVNVVKINTASIVNAVNSSGSSIAINADKIAMTGTTTFLKPIDLSAGGSTTIDGARITTGTISADRIDINNVITIGGIAKTNQTINNVTVKYAISDSNAIAPTSGWSVNAPTWENNKYMWQKTITTYADGSSVESSPINITGAMGNDGTSVNILGGYDTLAELQTAHPTGNAGDGYLIDGDLYIWNINNSVWTNIGTIQGPQGVPGNSYYTWYKFADTVTVDANGYGTTGTGMSDNPAGKVYIGIAYNKSSSTESVNWSDYRWTKIKGEQGNQGYSLQVKYKNSDTVLTTAPTDVSSWSDTMPAPENGKRTYMVQKLSSASIWSTPLCMTGLDGDTPTVTINPNNNHWIVNGEDSGIVAEGQDGSTPTVSINASGYWVINGTETSTKAQGAAGQDGANIEYVYFRSNSSSAPINPSYNGNTLTTGWTQSPQGVEINNQYEYVSVRTKPAGIGTSWGAFSAPVVWSKWGERGQDGDGVEYKYYRSNSDVAPTLDTTNPDWDDWTDDPQGVTSSQQYEYVTQIKTTSSGNTYSAPKLWAKYSNDGAPGRDGMDGAPGVAGTNGQTSYLHIKYSDNGTSFTSNNGETLGKYIGTLVDFIQLDSSTFSDYTWKKFIGEDGSNGQDGTNGMNGINGQDGTSYYFYVRYSANSNGSSMTTTPNTNTKYMGVCSTSENTAPTNYTRYTWTLIKGTDGADGNPGANAPTITNVKTQYCLHTSNTTAPGNDVIWYDTPPTYVTNGYYWTRTHTTYSNGNTTTSTPVYDEIATNAGKDGLTIGSWCATNDITKIDGGKIYTGTINANSIDADNLSAIRSSLGEITAGSMHSSSYGYVDGNTYSNVGMKIDLDNKYIRTPNFCIDSDGILHAKAADITGAVNATSGNIGGWTIQNTDNEKALYYYNGSVGTGMQPPNSGIWSFAAGFTDQNSWATAPFRVKHNGEMYATNATLNNASFITRNADVYNRIEGFSSSSSGVGLGQGMTFEDGGLLLYSASDDTDDPTSYTSIEFRKSAGTSGGASIIANGSTLTINSYYSEYGKACIYAMSGVLGKCVNIIADDNPSSTLNHTKIDIYKFPNSEGYIKMYAPGGVYVNGYKAPGATINTSNNTLYLFGCDTY